MMTFLAARLFSAIAAVVATATIAFASAPVPHGLQQTTPIELAGLAVPSIAA